MLDIPQERCQTHPLVIALQQGWAQGQRPELAAFLSSSPEIDAPLLSRLVRIDQLERWQVGERPTAEDYFKDFPSLTVDQEIAVDIAYQEFLLREQWDEPPDAAVFAARFPDLAETLQRQVAFHHAILNLARDDTHTADHLAEDTDEFLHDLPDKLPAFPGYELLGVVALGGMSTIYKAIHLALNRQVAIKVMADPFPSKPSRHRFAREAQSIARLTHANIVGVFDVGEIAGLPFLVLEFVDGGALSDHYRGHIVAPRDAAKFVSVLARAIQHCHDRGIIHRDLKPGNILLQHTAAPLSRTLAAETPPPLHSWTPKVTDFGLSKLQTGEADSHATRAGAILGTPAYMSPEQAAGDAEHIRSSTDIYSLGTILYELLTGRPPFQGHTPLDVVQQVVRDHPIAPSRLTRGLPITIETICLKCLSKQAEKRYLSCDELADDLERYLANEPIAARPPTALEKALSWVRHYPVRSSLLGAAAVVLMVGILALNAHAQLLRQSRADELVRSLTTAETGRVMSILDSLHRDVAEARHALAATPMPVSGSSSPFHLQFAKTYFGLTDQGELLSRVPTALPAELELLRELPSGLTSLSQQQLWKEIADPQGSPHSRLRIAATLAKAAPGDPRWHDLAGSIATGALREPIFDTPRWTGLLHPIREALRQPLEAVLKSGQARNGEALAAASILADHFADSPEYLARLAIDSSIDYYPVLRAKLPDHDPSVLTALHDTYRSPFTIKPPPKGEKQSSPAVLNHLKHSLDHARRRCMSAITLAHLGEPQALRELLRASPEPTARSYAIEWIAPAKLPLQWLLQCLAESTDPAIRRSCVLALGQFNRSALGEHRVSQTIDAVDEAAMTQSDAGLQSAVAWLRQRWQLPASQLSIDGAAKARQQGPRVDQPSWTNSQGQVFVTVKPMPCQLGSFDWQEEHEYDEQRRAAQVDQPFAMNRYEVTVAEMQRFRKNFRNNSRYSPEPRSPVGNVTFYDAAAYCRWLSEQEGIAEDQMCFPPIDQIKPGMSLPENYLERTGYRIPTEDEWELACRAGTTGSFCFGLDSQLMPLYGTSVFKPIMGTEVVGTGKPNDWGLFDMHGNVREWCVNVYHATGSQRRFDSKMLTVDNGSRRITRGGAFGDIPLSSRSSRIGADPPTVQYAIIGLRCVRTLSTASPLATTSGDR